jgi:ABC-2 type transport system ATP-binding protein
MAESVIETRGLTRYFGRKCAVNALSLSVKRGCVLGFLGRNGSGKTTTIRMLLGLLEPTRGSCTLLGHDSADLPPQVRARVGYLAEGHNLYGWMRVRECGEFQARCFEHWNDDLFRAVTDYFQLDPQSRVGTLSKGERAGLCLALTLAPEPELLILDDPALGLDPVARRSLLEAMVFVTRRRDRTIFFSSHLLSDVERVADRIAVLDRGELRASCALESFREHVRRLIVRFPGEPPKLPAIPGLLDSVRTEDEIAVTFAGDPEAAEEQLRRLGASHIEQAPIDLEEAFISYVGDRGTRNFLLPVTGAPS